MKNFITLLLICLAFQAFAEDRDYSGQYRMPGECAYRTASGAYESCVAWDKLKLKRLGKTDEYSFSLETHTFASTPGRCDLTGRFRKVERNGGIYMDRSDEVKDSCHLSLRFTKTHIHLEVPKSELDTSCLKTCWGANASFGSGPFPLKSRRK